MSLVIVATSVHWLTRVQEKRLREYSLRRILCWPHFERNIVYSEASSSNPGISVHRRLLLKCAALSSLWLEPVAAQDGRPAAEKRVIESLISLFNQNRFTEIYELAGPQFAARISKEQLVRFLQGNRNGGDITGYAFEAEAETKARYRLSFQLRNMMLTLKVDDDGKITDFGLSNAPSTPWPQPRDVQSDNAMHTPLDHAVDFAARDYFRARQAVGLSIGIITDGAQHLYHYGETRRGAAVLPSSNTIYEIGSITKTFTTTLLAQAAVEQRLSLSDDVRRYLPGAFPNLNYQGSPITLQHLANHTSRLPTMPSDLWDQPGLDPLMPAKRYDSRRSFAALRAVRLDGPPGVRFEYSNWGIAILGSVLQRVYQQPYPILLKRFITGPLAMTRTTYGPRAEDQKLAAVPYGENGTQAPFQNEGHFGPAGEIRSTLADMIRYLGAQIEEKIPAIKLTHEPTMNDIGLGWGVRRRTGFRELQHNGSTQGFTSNITVFPELKRGLFVIVNSKAQIGGLVRSLMELILPPKQVDR